MLAAAYLAKMRMRSAVRALFAAERSQRQAQRERRFRDQCNAMRERHYGGLYWCPDDAWALRQLTGRPVVNRIPRRRAAWPSAQWIRT